MGVLKGNKRRAPPDSPSVRSGQEGLPDRRRCDGQLRHDRARAGCAARVHSARTWLWPSSSPRCQQGSLFAANQGPSAASLDCVRNRCPHDFPLLRQAGGTTASMSGQWHDHVSTTKSYLHVADPASSTPRSALKNQPSRSAIKPICDPSGQESKRSVCLHHPVPPGAM